MWAGCESRLGPDLRVPCCLPDQHILRDLEKKKILVFTPSRRVGGKRVVCYDDRFIVKLAFESDGIVVSNDTYRDLQGERQEWKRFIEERLLMYSFVNDKYVPATAGAAREGLGWGGSVAEPCGLGPGQLRAQDGQDPTGEQPGWERAGLSGLGAGSGAFGTRCGQCFRIVSPVPSPKALTRGQQMQL